jgi:hypothetical protein
MHKHMMILLLLLLLPLPSYPPCLVPSPFTLHILHILTCCRTTP